MIRSHQSNLLKKNLKYLEEQRKKEENKKK